MSSRHGVQASARGVSAGGSASTRPSGGLVLPELSVSNVRVAVSQWSGYAWGAIGATTAFIGLTCWWLTQDRSIPVYDAGDHLETAFLFHQMLKSGELLGPLNHESPYPPFAPLVGAVAVFIGGVHVAPPIIGENLVFVSLMALGCYQTGRLLFGSKAGLLATVFVLGSALLIAQFHVFMLDAPEGAVVAVSIWLILACDDFSRVGMAGAAGLAVGVGLVTKVQYPGFVAGILAVALLRGGWRNRRGLVTFAAVAAVVAGPWYIDHLSQFSTFLKVSTENPIVVPGDVPPTFSFANFSWYFWNILNSQLMVPLFALLVGGTVWMAVTLFRHRRGAWGAHLGAVPSAGGVRAAKRPTAGAGEHAVGARRSSAAGTGERAPTGEVPTGERALGARLEFFAGAVVAWLVITATPSHDIRYAIPMLPYLAVIATGWIVHLPRAASWAAIAVLALGVVANTLGTTFGVGSTQQVMLVNPPPVGEEDPETITFYSTDGFLVAGPHRDGDVPGLLEVLHGDGVRTIAWSATQSRAPDFDTEGLLPLTRIAELSPIVTGPPEFSNSSSTATLLHLPVSAGSPPPCTRLTDGTGVWVARYNPSAGKVELFCPSRSPQFYGRLPEPQ
jgi:4-amino-4-deoxy-L-arabinose transferase-like glycosyltransferase